MLGISEVTLQKYKKTESSFLSAIKGGRIKADEKVLAATFKSATEGNVTAQIFWLSNRRADDWKRNRDEQGSSLSDEHLKALTTLAIQTMAKNL